MSHQTMEGREEFKQLQPHKTLKGGDSAEYPESMIFAATIRADKLYLAFFQNPDSFRRTTE